MSESLKDGALLTWTYSVSEVLLVPVALPFEVLVAFEATFGPPPFVGARVRVRHEEGKEVLLGWEVRADG